MMADIARDTIAALIAAQVRESSTTIAPFGYGVDLVCATDIDRNLAETDSTTVASLAQDAFHRVTTPRGSLVDDPNYGVDLRALLSTGLTPSTTRSIATLVHGELIKDDRIADTTVTLAISGGVKLPVYTVTITITPADVSLAAFDLVVSVTDGAALLSAILQ
jgi:phage baseplate assembly protein W